MVLKATSKTATPAPVPEFAMEDLPWGRIAAYVPEFAVKDLSFEQNTDDDKYYSHCVW